MSKFTRAIRMLARLNALDADNTENLLRAHVTEQDGGEGSGNFGHKGRPGKKGGSAPRGGGGGSATKSGRTGSVPKTNGASGSKSFGHVGRPGPSSKVSSTTKPMGYEKGKTPKILRKAESPEGVSLGEIITGGKKIGHIGRPGALGNAPKKNASPSSEPEDLDLARGPKHAPQMSKEEIEKWNKRMEEAEKRDYFEGMPKEKADAIKAQWAKEAEEYRKKKEEGSQKNIQPSGRWIPDPGGFRGTKEQAVAHFDLTNNMGATADWCYEHKNDFPEGSIEQNAYEKMEDVLANHSYRRPTPADSAQMIQERLSNISPQLQPYAVERYKKDMENEPQITKDVCDIADELGVQMHGLNSRTKVAGNNKNGVCRIQQKIEQDLADDAAAAKAKGEQPELTYEKCVDGLNDLVRYTQMSTEKNLVANVEKTIKALEAKNYKVVKVKNFYLKDPMENPYRGVTCVFESPTGTKFEMQFHTPRSLVAKEAMHPIYERDRNYDRNNPEKSTITKEEHLKLQERMRNVSNRERVPYPVGIERIKDFPPKKR